MFCTFTLALSEECEQCPSIVTFIIVIIIISSSSSINHCYNAYSFLGVILIVCSEITHKSWDRMWEYGRKYRILTILKPFSVGKFVVFGCDCLKCGEILFSLKNLAQMREDRCWGFSCVLMMKDTVEESYFDAVLCLAANITFLATAVGCAAAIFQQIEVEPSFGECH
jgi:hypothetical protein